MLILPPAAATEPREDMLCCHDAGFSLLACWVQMRYGFKNNHYATPNWDWLDPECIMAKLPLPPDSESRDRPIASAPW